MRQDNLRVADRTRLLLALAIVTAIPSAEAADAPGCTPWVAKAVGIQGQVETQRAGETRWQPVRLEQAFCGGDMIRVSERSRAAILLQREETTLRLDERSALTIPMVEPKIPGWLELLRGAANFLSRTPISLKIRTPFLNAHIEGTEFLVRVDEDETAILVFAGTVLAENRAGRVRLQSGQQAIAKDGQAPQRSLVLRPRDAVAWALYYPPIIDFRSEAYGGDAPALRAALSLYRQGKLLDALARLDEAPADRRNPRYFDVRAALLLSIGRVDEAQSDIAQALRLEGTHATAMALRSVIALVKNQKQKALRLARKAVAREPQSPVPRVALSYAQQAMFEIEAALESSEQAAQLAPDNGLAWARVAELELSLGRRGRALKAAEKAVALDPMLARTQTVLGFVALAQIQLEDAQTSFEKAIRFDSADPLPRLGLGLAKIRQGELDEGTEAIEIAASLDPNQSLIRSYLGKAYYEQKRDAVASTEYANAKTLDSNDPTPWFYDAIRKQTTNRAVEALHDLQRAIELNDNRLVYRSRLLLDSDLASRSANLGRIYSDLGFGQRALVEGWKSVALDPSDYSGHRFLADTYSVLPRHEIARASELLQSQLLQPLNINPVSPFIPPSSRPLEVNVEGPPLLAERAGPAKATFNEFNPLFDRDRVALYASGVVGNRNTVGDEIVASGIHGALSYSLGQSHFQTDGFRENNDAKQDLYQIFVQGKVTPRTSLQAEYRHVTAEQGDLRRRFDPASFAADLRKDLNAQVGRLGVHHTWSPSSDFLGSFVLVDSDAGLKREIGLLDERETREQSHLAEFQNSYRGEGFSLLGGLGHFSSQVDELSEFRDPDFDPLQTATDLRHYNIYVYSQLRYRQVLQATLGVSVDFLESAQTVDQDPDLRFMRNRVNPKVGLIWNPLPDTTVRLAAFRVVQRTLPSNQTLEPTQVAGFNQFFDDPRGVVAWRYGVGLDQRFALDLYAGAELSTRDLKLVDPILDESNKRRPDLSWQELLGRAYLYWAPHPWWALSAEYYYERLNRERNSVEGFESVTTQRVPLGIGFIHPSGLALRTTPLAKSPCTQCPPFPERHRGRRDGRNPVKFRRRLQD